MLFLNDLYKYTSCCVISITRVTLYIIISFKIYNLYIVFYIISLSVEIPVEHSIFFYFIYIRK